MQERIGAWARAACAWHDAQSLKVARFGDNMRQVAVTEGDKVEAQLRLGYLGQRLRRRRPGRQHRRDVRRRDRRARRRIRRALRRGRAGLRGGAQPGSLRDAARIELGLRAFLERGRLRRLHRHLRGPARPRAAAGHGGAAADGRRLRLRRRGRLEDGGARARHEGDGAPACRAAPRSWRTTPITCAPARRCWARTCSRSARRSQPRGRRARSTRSRSAARPIRCGSSSRPRPGRRSSSRCSTSATGSGWSRTRSTSSRPRRSCRGCPLRGRSGSRSPTSRRRPRPGCSRGAHITPCSPRPSASRHWSTSLTSRASSCSSSTRRRACARSRTSSAGTARTTIWREDSTRPNFVNGVRPTLTRTPAHQLVHRTPLRPS